MKAKETKQTKTKSKEAKTEGSGNTVEKSQGKGGTCNHVRHRTPSGADVQACSSTCGARMSVQMDARYVCLNTAKLKIGPETIHVLLVDSDKYTFIWKAKFECRVPGFLGICHWITVTGES